MGILRSIIRRRNIGPVLFFGLGIYTSLFATLNIYITRQQKTGEKKYNEFYNIEMVPDKPAIELIAYPNNISIYNKSAKKIGELKNTPVVYCPSINGALYDSLINVKIYGWIWTKSLGSENELKKQENIRYHANSHVIARLDSNTLLDTIYTNELKSWTLVTYSGFVSQKYLLTWKEFDDISRIKKFISKVTIKITDTKRIGGISVKPTTRPIQIFQYLNWQTRLVVSIFLFLLIYWFSLRLYIPPSSLNKKRKSIGALVSIASGIVVGMVIVLLSSGFTGK